MTNLMADLFISRRDAGYWLVIASIFVFAALLTMKYFPGLENEPMYAGAAYQIIHPDAFQGDPYRNPDVPLLSRPIHLSLMYGLVKVVGELWLNDLFLAFIYMTLVVAGLVGIDRIAQLLGATRIEERLIVLLMFLRDHQILTGKVLLAHHQDVNPTAFSIPVIVWLIYAALARKHLVIILGLGLLLTLISMRAALFPIFFSLMVVFFTGTSRERWTVMGLFAAGAVILWWGLYYAFPIAETHRLEIWDLIKEVENNDGDPFLSDELGNLPLRYTAWGTILAAAFWLSPRHIPALRGIRIIIICSILILVCGGLYINFAPDAIKQPLLISFLPARALGWPQNLAYIALTVGILKWLSEHPAPNRLAVGGLVLACLFVAGPGNLDLWSGLIAAAGTAVLAVHWFGYPRIFTARETGLGLARHLGLRWRTVFMQTLGLAVIISYAVAGIQKAAAWETTIRTGVYGGSSSAAWIGVAEYIRGHTPPETSVLTYQCRDTEKCRELHANRSLTTRSGRAMPTPEDISADFRNPESWKRLEAQKKILVDAGQALITGRLPTAVGLIDKLLLVPDYLIIPVRLEITGQGQDFPYAEEKRIGDYLILKRKDSQT